MDSKQEKNIVQIDLPVTNAYDALRFAGILEHILTAVWKTHGDGMADLMASRNQACTRFVPDPERLELDPDDLPF